MHPLAASTAVAVLALILAALLSPPSPFASLPSSVDMLPLPLQEWAGLPGATSLPISVAGVTLDVFTILFECQKIGRRQCGLPLVLVHGFPTSSYDWHGVAGRLSADRNVIVLDLPGYGLSDKPLPADYAYSLFDQAKVVFAVAAHYGVTSAGLVCHDMGDSVCEEMVASAADGAPHAVGLDIAFVVFNNGGMKIDMASFRFSQVLLRLPLVGDAFVRLSNYAIFSRQIRSISSELLTSADIDAMWASLLYHDGAWRLPALIGYIDQRFKHGESRWMAALRATDIPLGFIWGARDTVAPPAMGAAIEADLSQAGFVWLPDLGHFAMVEDPDAWLNAFASLLPRLDTLVAAKIGGTHQFSPSYHCAVWVRESAPDRDLFASCHAPGPSRLEGFVIEAGPLFGLSGPPPPVEQQQLAVGDLDVDGYDEIVFGTNDGAFSKVIIRSEHRNVTTTVNDDAILGVWLYDIDGDLDLDIIALLKRVPLTLGAYLNLDGLGETFSPLNTFIADDDILRFCSTSLVIGHFVGDNSFPDLSCKDEAVNRPWVAAGRAGLTFDPVRELIAPADIYGSNPPLQADIFNIRDNLISTSELPPVELDVNGDGLDDLVYVTSAPKSVALAGMVYVARAATPIESGGINYTYGYVAQSQGAILARLPIKLNTGWSAFSAVDVDGNGAADLIALAKNVIVLLSGPIDASAGLRQFTLITAQSLTPEFVIDTFAVGAARGAGPEIFVTDVSSYSHIALLTAPPVSSPEAPLFPVYKPPTVNLIEFNKFRNPVFVGPLDVNRDGYPDGWAFFLGRVVFVAGWAAATPDSILTSPTFELERTANVAKTAVGAIDADGAADIVFTLTGSPSTFAYIKAADALAATPAAARQPTYITVPPSLPGVLTAAAEHIMLADVVGDGAGYDIIITNAEYLYWIRNEDNAGDYSVFAARFGADYPTPSTSFKPNDHFMTVLDVNADSRMDIVFTSGDLVTTSALFVFLADPAVHGEATYGATALATPFLCNTSSTLGMRLTALTHGLLLVNSSPLGADGTPSASAVNLIFNVEAAKNQYWACELPLPGASAGPAPQPRLFATQAGDQGRFGSSIRLVDANGDGVTDITGLDGNSGTGFNVALGKISAVGKFELALPAKLVDFTGVPAVSAFPVDADADGVIDLVFSDATGGLARASTRFGSSAILRGSVAAVDVATCGYTVDCIAAALAQLPPSATWTELLLPPGRYTGCAPLGLPIRPGVAVRLVGPPQDAAGANHVALDCQGSGVLFSVAGLRTKLGLTNVNIKATAVALDAGLAANDATPYPHAAIVALDGAELVLSNVRFDNCSSLAATRSAAADSAHTGYGSAVFVAGPASARLEHVVLSGNRAYASGGAIAAVGESVRLELIDVNAVDNSAMDGSGGAVMFAGTGLKSQLEVTRLTASANTASLGFGGVLAIAIPATSGVGTISVTDSVFTNNAAQYGAGIGVLPAPAALAAFNAGNLKLTGMTKVGLSLTGLQCTENTASVAGGCLFSKASHAAIAIAGAVWRDNVAVFGGALGGVFTGYLPLPATPDLKLVAPRADEQADTIGLAALGSRAAGYTDAIGGIFFSGPVDSIIRDNVADYGGAIFGCQMPMVFSDGGVDDAALPSWMNLNAGLNGGAQAKDGSTLFLCTPRTGSLPAMAPRALVKAPLEFLIPGRDAFLRPGPLSPPIVPVRPVSTPPYALMLESSVPSTAVSGVAFGTGRVGVVDALGQAVDSSSLELELTLDVAAGASLGLVLPGDALFVGPLVAAGGASIAQSIKLPLTGSGTSAGFDLALVALAGATADQVPIARAVSFPTPAVPVVATLLAGPPPAPALVGPPPAAATLPISVPISACGPGMGASAVPPPPLTAAPTLLLCITCPPNTYSGATSADPCTPCPTGAFADGNGNTNCTTCPALSTPLPSLGGTTCTCLPGAYSADKSGSPPCLPCPTGGVCAGGGSPAQPAPGFAPSDSSPDGFVSCGSGPGCGSQGCKRGYRGPECTDCEQDFFKLGQRCTKCDGRVVPMILVLFVLGIAVAGALLWFNTRTGEVHKFGAIMIGLNSLQITAIYGKLALNWGTLGETWMVITSLSTYNLDLLTLECLNDEVKWKVKWIFTLCLPLLFIIPFAIVFVVGLFFVRRAAKKTNETVEEAEVGDDLHSQDDEVAMTRDSLVDATKRAYYQLLGYWGLFPVAIIGTLLYVVGIPLAVCRLLFKKREQLSELEFALRYGFLVGRFTAEAFAYELAIMGRKIGVVLAMVVFRDVINKANAALFVLGVCLVHLTLTMPYCASLHNSMAIVCLAAVSLVLWGGTMQHDDMRPAIVLGGIVLNIVTMLGGFVLDWRQIRADEEGAGAEAFVGALDYDGALVDDGDDVKAGHAMRGMDSNSVSLDIMESDPRLDRADTVSISDVHADSLAADSLALSSVLAAPAAPTGEDIVPLPPPLTVPGNTSGSSTYSSSD
ncbi:uncharacterized protein AMSG_12303 [Thecamonas trahens ATCC 50062]|uniref:AB hydrolase-1 domain-containing protein n=1 Tax=Thecamonas trahens ATCC 50062 TaxID=461836 RepID=A0A0L0DPH4_THETB|nr:hypothetical protein AMSG_12303 [Thecamonas trahens ATCC 50062]KNC54160.1 hypothetical protein AMSG_12303 [Thecamonas trahens ATCC 50062]|eukprot:XP_013754011.1 hypothetical protein AMSG_12303 [Thecamonas trahens ATCC 50062]